MKISEITFEISNQSEKHFKKEGKRGKLNLFTKDFNNDGNIKISSSPPPRRSGDLRISGKSRK